jgi:hypothetical protein
MRDFDYVLLDHYAVLGYVVRLGALSRAWCALCYAYRAQIQRLEFLSICFGD